MICRDCPAGRKVIRRDEECVMCIQYGIIIRNDHQCERGGWKEYEGNDGQRGAVQGEAQIFDIREAAARKGQSILSGSGE